MFFLVSGSAASGKTTAARGMSRRIENLEVHDADEKGAQDEFTRCQQLEEWVQLALQVQLAGRDFLPTSQSPWASCWSARRSPAWTESVPVCWTAATRPAHPVYPWVCHHLIA